MSDVGAYWVRQKGEGSPHFEPGVVHFSLLKCLKFQHLGKKLQDKASSSLFQLGMPPLSVYLHRHKKGGLSSWLNKQCYIFCFGNVWNTSAWIEPTRKGLMQAHFSTGEGRHWYHSHDKMLPGLSLYFCILQAIKTGRWEGLEMVRSNETQQVKHPPNTIPCTQ